jgi:hypothetical protein
VDAEKRDSRGLTIAFRRQPAREFCRYQVIER